MVDTSTCSNVSEGPLPMSYWTPWRNDARQATDHIHALREPSHHNRSLHVASSASPYGTSTAALKHHITKALKLDSIEVNMDFLNGLVILPYPLFLTNNCWVIPLIFTAKATTKPAALIFLSYTTWFKNQESSSPDAIERLNVHKALKNPSQSAVGSVVKSYCSGNQVTTGQGDITSLTNKEKNHQNLHKMSKFH